MSGVLRNSGVKTIVPGIVFACLFWPFCAAALDAANYAAGDLDGILGEKRPASGANIYRPRKLSFDVTIAAYGRKCDSTFLKKVMLMAGAPKKTVNDLPISTCIVVRSAGGSAVSMFIQDKVASFLPRELPLGGSMRVYCDFLYVHKSGPGLLINDFRVQR